MPDCNDYFPTRSAWFGVVVPLCFMLLSGFSYAESSKNLNVIGGDTDVLWRPVSFATLIPAEHFSNNTAIFGHIAQSQVESRPFTSELVSFGFNHDALVAKLPVQAAHNAVTSSFVLFINYPLLDEVKLFQTSIDGEPELIFHTGDSFPFESRPMRNRAFAFPITLEPGQRQTYYFVAKSRDTLELPVSIFTQQGFEKHAQNEQYVLGAYFGGVIVMAFFMMTLYVNYKDRTLIFMSIYLMCLAGVVGSVTGVASQVAFGDSPELAKNVRILWLAVAMMCTLLFGIEYLDSKKNMPRLHWGFVGVSGGCAVLPLLIPILPFYYLIQITLLFCLAVGSIVISASVIMLRKRYVPAIYYSIAWCWFIFGAFANVGRAFGLLPINSVTVYGFQWGSMVSVVCLGLGIASKFSIERANRLKLEKVAFQEKQNRLKAQIIAQEEQLKSKHAEAESKAKGEFLANMSHEIRTPMNGVLGLTQLLKDTRLDESQRNLLDTIETSGKTLLGVLNDILDYSKIESGKFDIEEIPVKPREVINNTVELFRQRVEEKGLSINAHIDDDIPEVIASDPTRLSQILLNLTSNALKFTSQGEINIKAFGAKDGKIRFEVTDTGIGLGEEQQKRLFNSFCQADSSTTRKYGGTGLGLYISRRLAQLMGGEIGVTSTQNNGATFWFTIAQNEIVAESELSSSVDKTALEEKIEEVDFSMMNLVVAEDNKVNQMVIKGLLGKVNIEPAIVENGAECVSHIGNAKNTVNCILMDCEMPEMDGYEATARIREQSGIQQPIIIGLSANALKEQEAKALDVGMNEYLRKPVDLEQLIQKLSFAKSCIQSSG